MSVTTAAPERMAPEPAPERAYATPLDRLSSLQQRAEAATGDARRSAASELNALLAQLSRHPSRPLADLLLRWLDQGTLADLEDAEGLTSRAAATAAVLSMGYPYALEISPDDLDHLRERSAASGGAGGTLASFLVVAVTAGFSVLELWTEGSWTQHLAHLASVLALLGAAMGMVLTRPRSSGRRAALLSLLLAGMLAMSLAATGSPSLLLPGLGALVAFVMSWPRRGS